MFKLFFVVLTVLLVQCSEVVNPAGNETATIDQSDQELPQCEWCGAMDAPENLTSSFRIAPKDEPGEPLVLSGTVYMPDKITPAKGVLIYAYHTNAEGLYAKKGDETGNGLRHGALRGWVRTDEEGHYSFKTIKPVPYPSRSEPAHIHMTLSTDSIPEFWIKSTLFRGDPLIKDDSGNKMQGSFNNIIDLKKDARGTWQGQRDILLEKRKS